MKNYKRILAAIGTAALLVSNLGAVSQVVFAEEGDVVEDVVDVSEDDVTAQVQEIIDQALEEDDDAPAVEEEQKDEEPDTPAEPEVKPAEEPTEGTTEVKQPEEPTEGTTEVKQPEEPTEGTTEVKQPEEPTEGTTEPAEEVAEPTEEIEEPALVSDAFDNSVEVAGTDNKISVHATAKENIIPDGARLMASLITREENEDEYDKVEQALVDSNNVDYTAEDAEANAAAEESDADEQTESTNAGFIAMDIRFEVEDENGDWSEVEPQGDVSITFDIAQDVLPVGVDEDSVTVHHLEEDPDTGDVEKVVTVADTTSNPDTGLVDVQKTDDEDTSPAAAVDFEVASFSTFTITWTYGVAGSNEAIHLFYVDENYKEIAPESWSSTNVKISSFMDDSFDLQYFVRDIDGYVFDKVMVQDGEKTSSTKKNLRYMEWGPQIRDDRIGRQYFWPSYIKYWDDDKAKYEYGDHYDNDAYVYLVYKKYDYDPTKETQKDPVPSVSGSKSLNSNGDGTFNIALDVTPTSGEGENKPKIDILFVLDTSSSMYKGWADGIKDGTIKDTRADAARKAILATMEDLESKANAHYGLVTFSTYANHDVNRKGTKEALHVDLDYNNSNYDAIQSMLNSNAFTGRVGITSGKNPEVNSNDGYNAYVGDTNYDAAMLATGQVLDNARSDAKKIVIFVTDGIPTVAFGEDIGTLWGNGNEYGAKTDPQDPEDLLKICRRAVKHMDGFDLTAGDSFYVVGVGVNENDFDTYTKVVAEKAQYTVTTKNLNGRQISVEFPGNGLAEGVTSKAINVTKGTDALIQQFKDIIAETVKVDVKDVTITDPLSENVEYVDGENLKVEINDGTTTYESNWVSSGTEVEIAVGSGDSAKTVNATPKVEGKNVILDFADGYTLESGWTYRIIAKVQPTDELYTEYRKSLTSDSYTYDQGAGQQTGSKGWHTNGYTDAEGTEHKANISYTYEGAGGTQTYNYADQPVITENDMAGITGTIKVVKNVVGLTEQSLVSAAEDNTQFVITVTKPSGDGETADTVIADVTVKLNDSSVSKSTETGKIVYTIDNNALKGLNKGLNYKVTEQEADGVGSQPGDISSLGYAVVNDANLEQSGTIAAGTDANVVTFTNTYKKMVVTGVETDNNMLPAVVATIDIMAAMFVIYHVAKRRVR